MTGSATGTSTARRIGPWSRELWAFVELLGVCGLVIAQPAYDLAGSNVEIFATRAVDGAGLVAFTLVVLLVPPLILWVVEATAGAVWPPARRVVHAGLIAALAGAWVAVALRRTGVIRGVDVAVGVGIAAGAFGLRLRTGAARTFLRLLAVAAPVFALLFVVASPAADAVAGADASAAAATPADPHRIVWITFDELPLTSLLDGHGQVDRELLPNFAALADRATWYRNSTTVAPYTIAALPAMLSGRMPTEQYAPAVFANHPDNVFTLLGDAYDVRAHESFTRLCPAAVCGARSPGTGAAVRGALSDTTDLLRSFVSGDEAASRAAAAEGLVAVDPDPVATTERFVRRLGAGNRTTFDFLHVLLPHWPWHYRGTLQDDGDRENLLGWVDNPWAGSWSAISGRQRHLLQVQATDTLLGRIMGRLRRTGAWDDSLVVVTADHGIGFAPGDPPRGLATAEVPDIVWTPLLVKYPGQTAGRVDDRPARIVDILPTIADVVGARIPWRTDGRSLRGAPADPERPLRVFHWDYDRLQPAPGSKYNVVDGRAGFAAVLGRRATLPLGDPALRPYRIGPYAGLVDTPVGDRLDRGPGPTVTLAGDPDRFRHVRPEASFAPWLQVTGSLAPGRDGVPLAVAVNGRVAAVTQTVEPAMGGPAAWWAALPPQMFRAGANDVRVYRITGPPTAARLVPARTS